MAKRTSKKRQLIHIQGRRAEAFRQLTAGIPYEQTLVAPLDIGKNIHWAAFHTRDGLLLHEPLELSSLKEGFERYTTTLDSLIATRQPQLVLLGHEPTGIYHEAWARQLTARYAEHLAGTAAPRFLYYLVNSYQVKLNRTQTTLSFNKTDLIDLGAIGDLLARGLGFPLRLPSPADLLLRQEVAALRALQSEQRRVMTRFLVTFDQLIPSALLNPRRFARSHPGRSAPTPLATKPLARDFMQALITLCPDPYAVQRLGSQGLQDLFHQHGYRCGPKTAAKILAVIDRAVLPPPEVALLLARQLQRNFTHYQYLAEQGQQILDNLTTLLPTTSARHLLAIPGASPNLVARYLALIGDPQTILFADQVWALAGLHPRTYVTGDVVVHGEISKEGDPALRGLLYQLGYQLAMHCAYFGTTFLRAIAAGKSETEATLHTAHQVNRVFLHLLKNDEPFDPPIPDYPALCQRWAEEMKRYQEAKAARRQRSRSRRRPRKKR
jgi:transposase